MHALASRLQARLQFARRHNTLRRAVLESLETRSMMSCATISGYAYSDANNNGIRDNGELPLANTHIVLRNSSNVIVGETNTDAVGFYQFDDDATVPAEGTIRQDFTIADSTTNWSELQNVNQFDPSLGTLTSVEILQNGTITTHLFYENTQTLPSSQPVYGSSSGLLTLSGPGFSVPVTPNTVTATFQATAFDGKLDFGGTSGKTFDPVSNTASGSASVTDATALAAYIGTSTLSVTQSASATSVFHGTGNFASGVFTSASAQFSIIYHYIPNNCLKPDTYTITETQPAGYLDGQDTAGNVTPIPNSAGGPDSIPVTVVPGTSDYPNNNFGELLPASIGDRVWFDINKNGVQDNNEFGISDVLVTLSNGATTTTDADGFYRFDNLAPGNYSVTFTAPDGFAFTTANAPAATAATDSDANVTTGTTAVHTLASGQYDDTVDAGLIAVPLSGPTASSLAGYVYADSNNDGSRAGEAPISGATVTLTGTDDLGQPVSLSTTTANDGSYSFNGLRPGTYALTESQPAGYLDGKDTIGTPGGTTSNDQFSSINLAAGVNGIENNFGEILPASISGYVYYDSNNDGSRAGESAIPNTTVTLTGTDDLGNPVTLSTATNTSGFYQFTNLRPGTYSLTETQPATYLDGKDTIGTPGGTAANDQFNAITLTAGTNGTENNFGELLPAAVTGFVYVDANNNGTLQSGETVLASVSLTLTGTDDLGHAVSLTTTTNANGFYAFTNLRPGTYSVAETQPANYLDGKDTADNVTPIANSATTDVVPSLTVAAGQTDDQNNFGELTPASISGYVYYDSNNDGSRAGETGINGATVTLTGTDDLGNPVSVTATTTSSGAYSFTNLRPGTYTLTESQPANYLDGKDTIGTPGGVAANDQFSSIVLTSGAAGTENNFGELLPAQISGYVYVDANNNGIKESGEAPIPGATVTLTGTNDLGQPVTLTATTATDGSYSFTNLRPGTYALTESQPAGYLDGKDTIGTPGGTTANDKFSAISLISGTNGANNNFGEITPATISGMVYADFNNNGSVDLGEPGIPNTTVTLTGTNDLGQSVTTTTATDTSGAYIFTNLRPGTYIVTETQPAGYNDGKDTLGTVGGVTVGTMTNDKFSSVVIKSDDDGINYNFGEIPQSGTKVACGMTATIGFWQNKNGQALIKAMNGSASCTKLGTWLATNFPNLFSTLNGKTNTDVAAYFTSVFKVTGQKLVAQTLAGALAVYVTDSDLAGGTYAKGYGFTVNSSGTGIATYNVGSDGSAAGLTNNTSYTVLTLLQKANAANIFSSSTSAATKTAWNNIFDGINQAGDIT